MFGLCHHYTTSNYIWNSLKCGCLKRIHAVGNRIFHRLVVENNLADFGIDRFIACLGKYLRSPSAEFFEI